MCSHRKIIHKYDAGITAKPQGIWKAISHPLSVLALFLEAPWLSSLLLQANFSSLSLSRLIVSTHSQLVYISPTWQSLFSKDNLLGLLQGGVTALCPDSNACKRRYDWLVLGQCLSLVHSAMIKQ